MININKIEYFKETYIYGKNKVNKEKIKFFSKSLIENIEYFKRKFHESADLCIKYLNIGNIESAIITISGMISKDTLTQSVVYPLITNEIKGTCPMEKFEYIRDKIIIVSDQFQVSNYKDAFDKIMSGHALFAMQGFPFRAVSEPSSELMQRGSREGFVEAISINMTLIRRRLKSPDLKFEMAKLGTVSKTSICLCYMENKVSPEILKKIKNKLKNIDLEMIIESGYVIPYLEDQGDFSLFSGIGMTERPDTVCGKISEGRVAILIDGTPNALLVPYLFVEYFQHLDDYSMHTYFATFTRWLKYLAFFMSTLLPGLYVGISTFNPEILPGPILNQIALAIGTTPFSLMTETIFIHLIYEIMREAGLRIPRPLGHAVSIVGALVIGETAVSSPEDYLEYGE